MKVGVIAAAVAALSTMVFASSAMAQAGQTEVCSSYDGKYELGNGWEGGTPAAGITISAASDQQVTITVAAGFTLSQFCYKTGSGGGGTTSLEAPVVGPATFTIDKTNAGGGISHITFDTIVTPAPPVVVDLCLNMDGNQETVPAGMVKDASGNCATPVVVVTDLCLNIDGNQETVPAGMLRDANGNCGAPVVVVTDLCPNIDGNQETVPAGMIKSGEGACVAATVVVVTHTSTPEVTPAVVVTPAAAVTPAAVVLTPAAVVVAPVAAKPASGVLGVSKTKVAAKAKTVKAKKKAKKAKAKAVKAKVVKVKVVKAKIASVRALPFTP